MHAFTFLTVVISAALLVLSCSSQKGDAETTQPLSISAEVENWQVFIPHRNLSIKATLTNNTPDTLRYITISCSWQDAYTVDTKELSIQQGSCDKNIPQLVAIPPHGREQRTLILATDKSMEKSPGLKFRLGFNWLTPNNDNKISEQAMQLYTMENVIWSAPLEFR